MTKANRKRLIQALLVLALVFGLLSTLADGARSLSIQVHDNRVSRIEVLQRGAVIAFVEFGVVPNEHTFYLPAGEYELRGMSKKGVVKTEKVSLAESIELRF